MNPQMIIFDEPTAALDPSECSESGENSKNFSEEVGMTITLSTQSGTLAYRWAERILVFADRGKLSEMTFLKIFSGIKNCLEGQT